MTPRITSSELRQITGQGRGSAQEGRVVVVLPLPPSSLHAHAKGAWRSKSQPTKQCRERAMAETMALNPPRFSQGVVSVDFYWPDLRVRDTPNALHSIKAYLDGIVDAGVLPDDNWRVMSLGHVRSHLDRSNPRVVVTVEGVEPRKKSPPDL